LSDATAAGAARQTPKVASFVPVRLATTTALEVRFPNGVQLTLPAFDHALVKTAIQAIAEAPTKLADN